jgi:phage terminase large subunit GpA-like protein
MLSISRPLLPPKSDVSGDVLIERVTVIKSARIGYTTILVGALANYVHNDPSSLMCLLPVKDDARNFVVSQPVSN